MSFRLSKQELFILVLSTFIVLVFSLGGYFSYLSPKKQELGMKEMQLETEQKLLTTFQEKAAESSTPTAESIAELQKKVPVKKQVEQLILDLNKAEVMSNSVISNMSFSEGEVTAGEPGSTDQNSQQATSGTLQESQGVESEGSQLPAPPEGIKKLNVNLSVTSPSYPELIRFLESLEGLTRLVVIESVALSGGSELTRIEQVEEALTFSLTLSAFYMPELDYLEELLPELDVPAPSNKTNPFDSFADLQEE